MKNIFRFQKHYLLQKRKEESKVKHGRKKKGVKSQTNRNKESDDNIMRKIFQIFN